jgi:hypothetical protein
MTNTIAYPTTQQVADRVCIRCLELGNKVIDLEEFIYEVISEWDNLFQGDANWFSEDGDDIKDSLRDQLLSVFA